MFTALANWRVELRAKIGHYRNRCFLILLICCMWLALALFLLHVEESLCLHVIDMPTLNKTYLILNAFILYRSSWVRTLNIRVFIKHLTYYGAECVSKLSYFCLSKIQSPDTTEDAALCSAFPRCKGTTIWFWGGGGGAWHFWSGQIIYFHHRLGRKIYFRVNRGQNIYFQPQQFFLKSKKKKKKKAGWGWFFFLSIYVYNRI